MKLLALCDSPTVQTGFARVGQNLLKRWLKGSGSRSQESGVRGQSASMTPDPCLLTPGIFDAIDVWGINYSGYPHELPYRIYPAGYGDWSTQRNLQAFVERLEKGDYTHLWMLQDTFLLINCALPKAVQDICRARKIRSLLYYPVDAPLEPSWLGMVRAVDVPVAYCEYGRQETLRADARGVRGQGSGDRGQGTGVRSQESGVRSQGAPLTPDACVLTPDHIRILPHGVDTSVYRPLFEARNAERGTSTLRSAATEDGRNELRHTMLQGWIGPDDFLMLNVNKFQRRKGIAQCLEILAELLIRGQGTGIRSQESGVRGHMTPVPCLLTPCRRSPKLLLHMPDVSETERTDLLQIGAQLGLIYGHDWKTSRAWVKNHPVTSEEWLNKLYNCADLVLTTTLGEGWGFSITEGLAAGVPVAVPNNTSCAEIAREVSRRGMKDRMFVLPLAREGQAHMLDNSRVRYPVDVRKSAEIVRGIMRGQESGDSGQGSVGVPLNAEVREWLDWDRIAGEWGRLFMI